MLIAVTISLGAAFIATPTIAAPSEAAPAKFSLVDSGIGSSVVDTLKLSVERVNVYDDPNRTQEIIPKSTTRRRLVDRLVMLRSTV